MAKQHKQTCPIAEFLNVFGDAWTMMIIRESFYGATRFSQIQRNTGIAKNLLSDRLTMLVDRGILERENVSDRGLRYAYNLTDKGQSLVPVFVAMIQWSNENLFPKGKQPTQLVERNSGERLNRMAPMDDDGKELLWDDIMAKPGPGSSKAAAARILSSRHGITSSA